MANLNETTVTKKQYLDMEGLALYDEKSKARTEKAINDAKYDDTELKNKITILNGDETVDGSVKKTVKMNCRAKLELLRIYLLLQKQTWYQQLMKLKALLEMPLEQVQLLLTHL